MIPVLAIKKHDRPFYGMTRTDYGYIIERHWDRERRRFVADGGELVYWLADIDEGFIEAPENWKEETEPCGHGIRDNEEMRRIIAEGEIVGFIQDGKLNITKAVEVERAWAYLGGRMIPTRTERVGGDMEKVA